MIVLEKGEVRRIGEGWIEVAEGRAWITWDKSGDFLLCPGDSCRAGKGAVAEALGGGVRLIQRPNPVEQSRLGMTVPAPPPGTMMARPAATPTIRSMSKTR